MSGTTQQILEHHLKAFGEGDLEGILEDYTETSLLFTPDGLLRGPGEMRALFEAFFAEFAKPGASFEMKKQIVEGETAYIVWSAERSSPNFPVKSPYGSPGSVKLLVPPTCFWGGTRFEVPRFS